MTKHIVFYSGGLGSYFTTKRILERGVKKEDVILLFSDTKTEDEDLYLFLKNTSEKLGIPITEVSDGRDIWQIFKDEKYLANYKVDPCSRILKRDIGKKWIKENYKPDECILYLGFDWTESHRLESARKRWKPYVIESPLCDPPYIHKDIMKKKLVEEDNIPLPRLYAMDFLHNNCGGGCVKAGIGHFANLYKKFPERYAEWENNEREIREFLDKDVSILERKVKGVIYTFTLEQLRKDIENLTEEELWEYGGCGCYIS